MSDELHLEQLKRGVKAWNQWRAAHPTIQPDLCGEELCDADFSGANLVEADLSDCILVGANFTDADLTRADLTASNLNGASFIRTNLHAADLCATNLFNAQFLDANLNDASLKNTFLYLTTFRQTNFEMMRNVATNFTGATLNNTIFSALDLSDVIGLETVQHDGPSTLGFDSLLLTEDNLPLEFLRGCGLPEEFIVKLKDYFFW